ncbi:glycosyltransferase family 4 protein [Halopenitus persicus]|uniref:glycosyltransferase family 4 protein n=1 Tax=Halopenitus persicus TaxID=1048396 RepID=UPI000BBAD335|nr:glycosyltransferase family 4 protein [Halopenitus persicus]
MHVGLVVYDGLDERSGGYRYDRQLVSHLRDRGDDVEVIALPRKGTLGTARAAFSPSVRRALDRPFDVLLQDALCEDVLWRHNRRLTEPDSVVAIVHLLRSAEGQTGLRSPWRWLERRYLGTVDGMVCPSAATRTATEALASRPAVVAYPAGRHEGRATDRATVRSRASETPFTVAFVGNVVPRKGAVTLLEALTDLAGDWRATIVGDLGADPEHARAVRRAVDRHDASSRIELLGAVSDDRLAAVLEEAHVLAVPSRRESFGIVYLEAMEHGTVPVATTVGGPPEFVVDGYNGRLVPPDDPAALRTALQGLVADRETLASLGAGALETAGAHYTWADSMARVRRFLRSRIVADVTAPPAVTVPAERVSGATTARSVAATARSVADGRSIGSGQRDDGGTRR